MLLRLDRHIGTNFERLLHVAAAIVARAAQTRCNEDEDRNQMPRNSMHLSCRRTGPGGGAQAKRLPPSSPFPLLSDADAFGVVCAANGYVKLPDAVGTDTGAANATHAQTTARDRRKGQHQWQNEHSS